MAPTQYSIARRMGQFLAAIAFAMPFLANAQVAVISRHIDSYSKEVFDFSGSRLMMVDEASISSREDNVYLFSKPDQSTTPDALYFQQYKKLTANGGGSCNTPYCTTA